MTDMRIYMIFIGSYKLYSKNRIYSRSEIPRDCYLNRKSNEWKQKNKWAANSHLKDKCLGFHKWYFKHVRLFVR